MLPSYFILKFLRLETLSISAGSDSILDTVKCEFFGQIGNGADLFHSTSVLPTHYYSTGIPFSHFINLHKRCITIVTDLLTYSMVQSPS